MEDSSRSHYLQHNHYRWHSLSLQPTVWSRAATPLGQSNHPHLPIWSPWSDLKKTTDIIVIIIFIHFYWKIHFVSTERQYLVLVDVWVMMHRPPPPDLSVNRFYWIYFPEKRQSLEHCWQIGLLCIDNNSHTDFGEKKCFSTLIFQSLEQRK